MRKHERKRPVDPYLGPRIELWRLRRRMTLADLGSVIGRTPGAISHWESGRYEPPRAMIVALAAALRITTETLMGDNLTEEDRAAERAFLEMLRAGGPELVSLLDRLTPAQVLAALRTAAAADTE